MDAQINRQIFTRFGLLGLLIAAALWTTGCETGGYGGGAGSFNTVVVDAGHGGHDQGAIAVSGQPEKMLTLDTAHRLSSILRSRGFRVIETRNSDYFVPLEDRVTVASRASSSIFVSIHYNCAPRKAPHGIETYYYSPRSHRLAANILKQVLGAYPTINRGVKSNNYHVLRTNRKPAVLCELGFVSSPYDNQYLQNPDVRQRLAERIAAGIIAEQNGNTP